ncbi:MAG: acyl-CoA dehydrogenase family protein, partial [Acidimicrobiia bacterium]
MPIGITTEHEELRQAVRRFVETRITPAVMRAALDAAQEEKPPFWAALREPGWLGLHIAEANGGAGFGLVEQAVVIEELGRAAAPGPYVPTVVAAAVLDAAGGPAALLAHLASGERTGAVALTGTQPVLGGGRADVIVCEVEGAWYALDADAVTRTPLQSVDPTRPVVRVEPGRVAADRRLAITTERVQQIAAVLFAAEAISVAQWCVDTAAEHAKARVQFGRP